MPTASTIKLCSYICLIFNRTRDVDILENNSQVCSQSCHNFITVLQQAVVTIAWKQVSENLSNYCQLTIKYNIILLEL